MSGGERIRVIRIGAKHLSSEMRMILGTKSFIEKRNSPQMFHSYTTATQRFPTPSAAPGSRLSQGCVKVSVKFR